MRYAQGLEHGLRNTRMGEKTVTWEIGVFAEDAELSSVTGRFTHAFVDRKTNRSAPIPEGIRTAIERLN